MNKYLISFSFSLLTDSDPIIEKPDKKNSAKADDPSQVGRVEQDVPFDGHEDVDLQLPVADIFIVWARSQENSNKIKVREGLPGCLNDREDCRVE